MRLFNLEGSAIFGPGSEWFWSMAQFILVAVTLIGIYYQLRLARAANAFEQIDSLQRELASERITRQILDVLVALRGGMNPANLPDAPAAELANYWDKLGLLTRDGHIDRKMMWNFVGSGCQVWWATLAPFVQAVRAKWADPTLWVHFEWLAGVMQETDRRAGVLTSYDEALLASLLEGRITGCLDSLRLEQALRTVMVASPENVTVGQAPLAPPSQGPAAAAQT